MATPHNWNPISFTRLRITLSAGEGYWSVPVDYYRLLRAAIYRLLTDVSPDLGRFLHAGGFTAEFPAVDWRSPRDLPAGADAASGTAEHFKLFCFSSLIGQGSLRSGLLSFAGPVTWFVATPLGFVADALMSALHQGGTIRLGRTDLKVTELSQLDEPAAAGVLTAVLLSPLVISATVPAQGAGASQPQDSVDPAAIGTEPVKMPGRRRRRYLTREDGIVVTEARLRANLLAKHRAIYAIEPADPELSFLWAASSTAWPTPDRPTRLVRLSGPGEPPVRVRGNLGAVTLAGTPQLLQVALHAGLGQHNASGMGFILPESESHLLRI